MAGRNGEDDRNQARALIRTSFLLRHVDCGSCNACESELGLMFGPDYDAERAGIAMAASPRHADGIIVTGPGTVAMRAYLERTRDAVTDPSFVVALGDCAVTGGVHAGGYAVDPEGSAARFSPDLGIPGCPPTPAEILAALKGFMQGDSVTTLPGRSAPVFLQQDRRPEGVSDRKDGLRAVGHSSRDPQRGA